MSKRGPKRTRTMPSGMGVTDTGFQYNPAGRPVQAHDYKDGEHFWVAIASYRVSAEQALAASEPGNKVLLDMENLLDLGVGCFRCEKMFTKHEMKTRCEGKPSLDSYLELFND